MHTSSLKQVQIRIFWSLMIEPLAFVGKSLRGEQLASELQGRIHESLEGRPLQLCLTKTSEFGLDVLLGRQAYTLLVIGCRLWLANSGIPERQSMRRAPTFC